MYEVYFIIFFLNILRIHKKNLKHIYYINVRRIPHTDSGHAWSTQGNDSQDWMTRVH